MIINNKIGELKIGSGGIAGTIITWLMFAVALLSSWATYEFVASGLTYLTLPVLMCIFVVLIAFLSGFKPRDFSIADGCLLMMYMVGLFSLAWTLGEEHWPQQIYWYSICLVVYFAVRFFITTPARIRLVGYGVLVGVVIASMLISEQTNEWGEVLERQSIGDLNTNFTSYVLAGSFYIFILIRRFEYFPAWFKFLSVPIFIFIFIKLLLLGTRGALISMCAMFFWILFYKYIPKRLITPLVAALFVAVSFFSFGFLDSLLIDFDLIFNRSTGDLAGRLPAWAIARAYISQHLFLGIGVGVFPFVNSLQVGAHNVFLTLLLDVGLLGFCFFLLFLVGLFGPALKKGASSDNKFILGFFFFFWLPIAISGHWELAPFSWLLLGLTFNLLRVGRERYA